MRAERLSAQQRMHIASLGGKARATSLRTARRIAENFRYVAVLRELRQPSARVTRQDTFHGRLPGIYPAES